MFSNLSNNLGKIFQKLKGKTYLSENDVEEALREIRVALFQADVALPVVQKLIASIKLKAIGAELIKSVNPSQQVVKIVSDEIENLLSTESYELNLKATPPAVIMMLGLQGSGKTTSSAKLAGLITKNYKKKVLLASLDTSRPAAQEQLSILAKQLNIDCLEIVPNQRPLDITKRALAESKSGMYDVLILDTAGRLHSDEELIDELKAIEKHANPIEKFLVADALTGQIAVNVADTFNKALQITGIILTRIDGDARGGAALSMKGVTGCPIKFIGVGEKLTDFEVFVPERMASRILGMGDIVTLVEQATEAISEDEVTRLSSKIKSGRFDMNDLLAQLKTVNKMGGVTKLIGFLPGLSKIQDKLSDGNMAENKVKQQIAIIQSMTPKERKIPDIINASRKKRIAAGSGTSVESVNRLLKQHTTMLKMLKKFGNMSPGDMLKMQRMING